MAAFLADLFSRREPKLVGFTNISLGVMIYGGTNVEVISHEPDPTIYRYEYYYNSTQNILYRKIVIQQAELPPQIRLDILKQRAGIENSAQNIQDTLGTVAYWKMVSNPRID